MSFKEYWHLLNYPILAKVALILYIIMLYFALKGLARDVILELERSSGDFK